MDNEILKNMRTRRSVRKFKEEMPTQEQIDAITEAGTYAATGHGSQSPVIVEITDKETRELLTRLNAEVMGSKGDPFYGAPVILLVLADKTCPTYLYDGSLVMGNMMNAAHAVGLGSCWIHRAKQVFESETGKALLKKWGIKGDYEGIGHCAVGIPAKDPMPAKPRKADYVVKVK